MKFAKIGVLAMGLLMGLASVSQADNYALMMQSKSFYNYCYSYYSQDFVQHDLNEKNLKRYGFMILNENMTPDKEEWLADNVWLFKKDAWVKQRMVQGKYIPRVEAATYLGILLEKEGIDIFRDLDIVGRNLAHKSSVVSRAYGN